MKFAIILFFLSFFFPDQNNYIHLISTNDIHGKISEQKASFMNPSYPPTIVGGAGYLKYLSELRNSMDDYKNNILLLDGGNFFQGTNFGLNDGGTKMIEWMNRLEYTALVPGKDDFILGAKNLNRLAELSRFPFLAANISCNDCELTSDNIKPFIIKEMNGVKVGILGIVDSRIEELVLDENKKGINITKELNAINRWVPILKVSGAEVIIILTSSGVPWDREKVYTELIQSISDGWDAANKSLNALQMAYFCKDVDFIVSGGNSKGYALPWYDPNSNVYVSQNYGNGTEFGHLKLLINKEYNLFSGYETVVANRASQTLLSDDFNVDFKAKEWIDSNNQFSIMDIDYSNLYFEEKNIFDDNFNSNQWEFPKIGLEDNLDIVTWNCEFFPTAGDSTIQALSEAIIDLDVDIIALQEIKRKGWFSKLMKNIPNYGYVVSRQSSFMDMAILYKKSMFKVTRHYEVFADNDYNFAGRPPLQVDFLISSNEGDIPLSIINLHMKCCDSGLNRRKKASQMLYDYVSNMHESTNLIILGDWNDDTKDKNGQHCFDPFFNDDKYYFPTSDISYDVSQATYPKEPYVSFLDHILVSESFLPKGSQYHVETIRLGDYMGGFEVYESYISDHRPVILSFPIY